MEHLSLEIFDLTGDGSKYAALEGDASITITETSEIFAEGDVWSYNFKLNILANAHIFGSAGDIHGTMLHDQIHKRKSRLWVEGVPRFTGYLILGDEADVDENGDIDVRFESGQKTFKTMIEGAKANQVPLMNEVRFGMALWQKRLVPLSMYMDARVTFVGGETVDVRIHQNINGEDHDSVWKTVDGEDEQTPTQDYPRMVFPKGSFWYPHENRIVTINDLNTDHPYTEDEDGTPTYPFCNVALCYQKYDYLKQDANGNTRPEYNSDPEAQREYEVMPANRVNSAPNFYVLYWLRCLMTHLGIHIDENQMLEVEDLRRLFMVNTKCAFKLREKDKYIRTKNQTTAEGVYKFQHPSEYREGCSRRVAEYYGQNFEDGYWLTSYRGCKLMIDTDPDKTKLNVKDFKFFKPASEWFDLPDIEKVEITGITGTDWGSQTKMYYESQNNFLHEAFATKECFPNVNISDIIDALEKGFGMRLLFDGDYKRVRIVLLRNIFRSDEVQELDCEVEEEEKVENNIRGFRMTYGDSTDTAFYYKGFADKLPHKAPYFIDDSDTHDYSQWSLNEEYSDVVNKVSAFNKTCYVTPKTGNAYVVKVDKDAKRYIDLHPSLFEAAGFMDAENGDCSGDEETIETVSVGFTPAIMNDLNMDEEKSGVTTQRFALFVDEKMRVRRHKLEDNQDPNNADYFYNVDELYSKYTNGEDRYPNMRADDGIIQPGLFSIKSDIHTTIPYLQAASTIYRQSPGAYRPISYNYTVYDIELEGNVNAGYYLYLQDNFEPNDDGVSPIETHDWGLTFGIMRGSGSDATVSYTPDYDDGQGNDTWEVKPGSSVTAHPDTCDSYGHMWDYDGQDLITTSAGAIGELSKLFPDSNAEFNIPGQGHVTMLRIRDQKDNRGDIHRTLFAKQRSITGEIITDGSFYDYIDSLEGLSTEQMLAVDRQGYNIIIEIDSSDARRETFHQLIDMAYGGKSGSLYIDNGVGSRSGRFSLKLREKKPNPRFNEKQPEGPGNKRYLTVSDRNLRNRGLIDQFYKEYSKWLIDGRIIRRTVPMTFAQLSTLDKTKKVRIGDITGYVRKLQYSVNKQTGLGHVTMEILYI